MAKTKKKGPRQASASVSVEQVEKRTYKDSAIGRYMEDLNQIAENAQALAVDVQENEDWLLSFDCDDPEEDVRGEQGDRRKNGDRWNGGDGAYVRRSYRVIAQAFADIERTGKKAGWLR